MNEQDSQDILLESGTNEMEIIEFYLGDASFGINVLKMREIIVFDPDAVTSLPDMPPAIPGTLVLRGKSILLIDLMAHLNLHPDDMQAEPDSRRVILICEINDSMVGIVVDGVNRIHRASWESINPVPEGLSKYKPRFTGSLTIDKTIILLIDLESILAEYDPSMKMDYEMTREPVKQERRQNVHLMMAEDSPLIRDGIMKVLTSAGYDMLSQYADGEECYEEVLRKKTQAEKEGRNITEILSLVITDIEMPKMDGLTLCRKIKKGLGLTQVKVIIFSSMINEQMATRCEQVGADAYITKPEIPRLIKMVDNLLHITNS